MIAKGTDYRQFKSKAQTHLERYVLKQGFPAPRNTVTTHVKKISYFFTCVDIVNQLLNVTRLTRHSVRLMNERQNLRGSQYKLFVGAFSNYDG